jgi:hypothetical protein
MTIQCRSVAELSSVLDIPLIHTLAQASATFIAILAGFYTTKVLSIASDKNRLAAKIKEIHNELQWRKEYAMELREKVNRIDNLADEEYVRTFRSFVVDSHFDGPPTPDKIRERFRKYAGARISLIERHEGI